MKTHTSLKKYPVLLSAALLLVNPGAATAQETLNLEEVVVTASAAKKSRIDSSLSVTSVSSERIEEISPRSTTEIFRSIPGVRSESSAGESNTNISIRGIPVATGGGKFLQLHEDGLPVLQFGDIIVGNADNYITYDWTVGRIEAVKGGSAATLASNSPAGVINFVSKTGEEEGGRFGVTAGLDYDSQRFDFEYGSPLGNDSSFHIGGYYRKGEGVRETGFDGNNGGQIKLSFSRQSENGSARVYVKLLDDRTTTYLPMPMLASGKSISGFDALKSANVPRELGNNLTGDFANGTRRSSIEDGSLVESRVLGGEFEFNFSDNVTVRNRLRVASNSGKFFGAFTANLGAADTAADLVAAMGMGEDRDGRVTPISSALGGIENNDQGTPDDDSDDTDTAVRPEVSAVNDDGMGTLYMPDNLRYASGPRPGEALTAQDLAGLNGNGLVQNIRSFDNDINNLDNFTNDLSFTIDLNDRFTVTIGYYFALQDIDIDWFWQTYIADVADEPRLFDVYSGDVKLTENGLVAFGAPDWGGCCYRRTTLETEVQAVYLAVDAEINERLTLSASVRYDDGEGKGDYAGGSLTPKDLNGDSVTQLAEVNAQSVTGRPYEYSWDYVSYALGANYLVNDSLALFANISQGGRANADRLGDGPYVNADGTVASGSVENEVRQYEFGVKHERDLFGVFATAFYVETEDANADGTRGDGSARVREYESTGLELEAVANINSLSFFGSMTWTDAEISDANDRSLVGNTPRRQADFVYSGTVSYQWQDRGNIALNVIGTTDSYAQDANGYEMDGYAYLNLFASYDIVDSITLSVSVNNITDEYGITEAEENAPLTIKGVDYVRARSIAGRSANLSLSYRF